jgi:hypothetical protein
MLVICSAPVISPLLFNCFLRFSHLLYFIKHHQKPLLLLPLVDFFFSNCCSGLLSQSFDSPSFSLYMDR